jgi:hypothetical protein
VTSKKIHGHALMFEGRAYTHDAYGLEFDFVAEGRGGCECGARSPALPSNNARKRWHREHKDAVIAALAADKPGGEAS